MFNKKNISLLLVCVMVFSVVTGCQKKDEANKAGAKEVETAKVSMQEGETVKPQVEETQVIKLSDWDGTWNNLGAYLEDEELQQAFKDVAENKNITVEEAKSSYVEKRRCDFDGLIIEGDNIIFLNGFKDKGGKEIEKVEYVFNESRVINNGKRESTWHVFEAKGAGKYKFMIMIPVHGEEHLTHFHFRYGDDLEELLTMNGWVPTFIKPNATYEQIYGEIAN